MNFKMIRYTLGWLMIFEAGFLTVPLITSLRFILVPNEWKSLLSIFIGMIICSVLGTLCVLKKPKNRNLYAKDGLVVVALSWIVLSLLGAIPLYINGLMFPKDSTVHLNFIDCFFEISSGFTTTGSSILKAVEDLPKGMIMWRSFTHWVGGMGVLVFIMAFLPLGGAQNLHIMRAESPGPTVSKLVPKMKKTAFILYLIYFILTVVMFITLLFDNGANCENGKMSVFEAINTAFATAGTGGFGFKNDSFAGFSDYAQIVVTIFMIIFSVNFSSYYLVFKRRFKDAFNLEVIVFFLIVIIATLAIAINIYIPQFEGDKLTELLAVDANDINVTSYTLNEAGELIPASGKYSFGTALKHAAFNVATIMSTSGFGTENFVAWPEMSQIIIVVLMFVGACAGSTCGGIKISRILILVKGVFRELKGAIHPRQVNKITMDKRPVPDETVRSVNAYIACYIIVFVAVMLLISLDPFVTDLTTAFTSTAATINNVGPGLGDVGPTSNFSGYNWFSTLVLSFAMIAGRLELIPMLILFSPKTWRKN